MAEIYGPIMTATIDAFCETVDESKLGVMMIVVQDEGRTELVSRALCEAHQLETLIKMAQIIANKIEEQLKELADQVGREGLH